MASIRHIQRADGTTAFKVIWREAETKKQTSFTTDSDTEAELIKRLLDANGQSFTLANKAMQDIQSQTPTVAKLVTMYLEEKTGVEPGTKHTYEVMLARHIAPSIGPRKTGMIERKDLVRWFEQLQLAPKSKKNVHAFLSTVFNWAIERNLMEENPARGISSPKSSLKYRGATFLTREQFEILCDHIDPDYELFLRTLVNSGLRFSEATALDKADFAHQASGHYVIDVNKSWKRTPHGFVLGSPKTLAGVRQVTLPLFLTPLLDEHLRPLKSRDLVFQHPNGGRLSSGIFYARYWRPAIEAANAPEVTDQLLAEPRLHDLRHTHVSWLIAAKVPLPVISKRLGHSSISTTVDVYGHLSNDADLKAADAL